MRILALVLLTLLSTGAHAAAREKLDAFSRDIQGLSANFSQRVFASDGALKESSSGTVQLQAPRQFRWEYLKPFRSCWWPTATTSGSTTRTWSR